MAATGADTGFGVLLKEGDGGSPSENFATLAVEVTSLTPPGYTRDAPDASHTQSPDHFREFITGFMDAGEVQMDINFIPSAADVIVAAVLAGKKNWQLLFPGICTWTFAAICTSYQPSAPIDDKMTASITWKVSGKPVLAAV